MRTKKIVVVGGGIAGLAAAYYALKKSSETGIPLELVVLESGSYWGGKITTTRREGFVIEGGPDTFLATKPYATALCRELGLGERLHGTNPKQRNTYVLHKGRLAPLPDGLAMMIPTNFRSMAATRLLTWPQKARMGLDFILPPRALNGDESLGAFVSRRLGRAAYENLIEPLMSGIYAGDGDLLSLASTFPYLRDMEIKHGGLVKGALSMKRQAQNAGKTTQGSRSAFLTPTTGLAEIVEALVAWLDGHGASLRLNSPAEKISILENNPEARRYKVSLSHGEGLLADGIILAAPAFASAALLRELDESLAETLGQITYVSTATVSLAYHKASLGHSLDGYGYVNPRREGRKALACTWTSTKFPHRAPDDYALLRVFVGRAGQHIPWNEADLLALAREELKLTLGIKTEPVIHQVTMWDKAMPQYNLGHPARLKQIDLRMAQHPGLALAGNGYRGIGIPDCIRSGELAASRMVEISIKE